MENKNLIEFLNKEYEITFDSWKFIHEDRSKYVTIFISLLAGTGYAFFKAVDGCSWLIAIFIAILSGFINFFFLRWFIGHRASSLIYRDRLNRIRNKLCDLSDGDQEIKKIIINTRPINQEKIPHSRENEFYNIIILLIVLNISAAIYILVRHFRYLQIDLLGWILLFIIIALFISIHCYSKKYLSSSFKQGLNNLRKRYGEP